MLADHDSPAFPKTSSYNRNRMSFAGRHRRSGSLAAQLQSAEDEFKLSALSPRINGVDSNSATPSPKLEQESDTDDSGDELVADLRTPPPARPSNRARSFSGSSQRSRPTNGRLTEVQQQQKALLQVVLLEAGILFHSVFIGTFNPPYSRNKERERKLTGTGMALSVATGSNFIVLLIAILFHRRPPSLPPHKAPTNVPRNLRRPRPGLPHRRHPLLRARLLQALAHGPRLRHHYSHRTSHRTDHPQPLRPWIADGIADGGDYECYQLGTVVVCGAGGVAC